MGYDMKREKSQLKDIESEAMMSPEDQLTFLTRAAPDGVFVLCEDRSLPVFDSFWFPARWAKNPEPRTYRGTAMRGEYFAFQVVIYSADADAGPVDISYDGFGLPVDCFNAGGLDMRGKPFAKEIIARKGRVQPLWFGVQIPEAHNGTVCGTVTLTPKGMTPVTVSVTLNVDEQLIEDYGDAEPWRHSRLRWLNSDIAIDDEITHPYTPLKVKGNTIRSLGHKLTLDEFGLPAKMQSYFGKTVEKLTLEPIDILRDKAAFSIEGAAAPVLTRPFRYTRLHSGAVCWASEWSAGSITVSLSARMEYDGYIEYDVSVTATVDTTISDIRLTLPYSAGSSAYWMGLGELGGFRKNALDWKWDMVQRLNQDTLWMGAVNAGMMLRLKDENYKKPPMLIYYHYHPLVMPSSWANNGSGGVRVPAGDSAAVTAYSGARSMKAGETLRYMFDLALTPVKPIDKAEHWTDRYIHNPVEDMKQASKAGANIINVHHANWLNPWVNYPFIETERFKQYVDVCHDAGMRVKLYYTVKEITVNQTEFWAFKSLGDELIPVAWEKGKSFQGLQDASYKEVWEISEWMDKFIGDEYMTAWRQHVNSKDYVQAMEASVVAAPSSRFNNYFLEGVRWLLENTGMDGLYFDDVAFDRSIMKRCRKVLDRDHPHCTIDLHSWNYYKNNNNDDPMLAGVGNSMNLYIDNFAFIDRIWFGEGFDYDIAPDAWLVEVSGIPFGMMGEMLQNGGNPWRGMVYGMTGRPPYEDPSAMWNLWNKFGMLDAVMVGWWNADCPVKTNHPGIRATVFKRPHKIMVSIGSWADADADITLEIDYAALGLDPARMTWHAPGIPKFQEEKILTPDKPVHIPAGKGLIIIIE
jgi:hypothetical protein